jgi:hypothetical protein
VGLELLLIAAVDLDYHVEIGEVVWDGDLGRHCLIKLSFISILCTDLLSLRVIRHHVSEGLGVVLDEGCSGEHEFCIDVVVLDHHLFYVDCFELQRAVWLDFDTVHAGLSLDALLLVEFALLDDLGVEVFVLLLSVDQRVFHVVKFAIELVELVLDRKEEHAPRSYWVVVVIADDGSRFEEVFLSSVLKNSR